MYPYPDTTVAILAVLEIVTILLILFAAGGVGAELARRTTSALLRALGVFLTLLCWGLLWLTLVTRVLLADDSASLVDIAPGWALVSASSAGIVLVAEQVIRGQRGPRCGRSTAPMITSTIVQDLRRRHEHVLEQNAKYHYDLDLALEAPALQNVSVLTTRALILAMEHAETVRDAAHGSPRTHEQAYTEAVEQLEKAFAVAVEHAHLIGDGSLRARAQGLLRRWRSR